MLENEPSESDYFDIWFPDKPESLVILKNASFIELWYKDGKVLPNFIIYQHMFPKGSFYKSAIYAMKNQNTNQDVLVDIFCELARLRNYPRSSRVQIEEFKIRVKRNILRQYTQENFFHMLLNNTLRYARDITDIFYVQPFVKRLFETIQKQYLTYTHQEQKQLICYRGAYMTAEQQKIFSENIGQFIESLGFLSTSEDRSTALAFATNTLIQITVKDQERDQKHDHGYVFMRRHVDWEVNREEEVLFNVLSSFTIVDVGLVVDEDSGRQLMLIELEYGKAAALRHKYKKNWLLIPEADRKIIPMLISQHISTPTNQKSAIFEDIRNTRHCEIYLKRAMKLFENLSQNRINNFIKLQTLGQLSGVYYITHKLEPAHQLYQIIKGQPRTIPQLSDKALFQQYQQVRLECCRCHPIADYMLRTIIIAAFLYYSGNFSQAILVIEDAKHYFKCLENVRPHEIKLIGNIYHTYYSAFSAVYVFCLYLVGRKEEVPGFVEESKRKSRKEYGEASFFILKMREVQATIFGKDPYLYEDGQKPNTIIEEMIKLFGAENNHYSQALQKGGMLGFISAESTKVFYQLFALQQLEDRAKKLLKKGQNGEVERICKGELERCRGSVNRLEEYFAVLRLVPCLIEAAEEKDRKRVVREWEGWIRVEDWEPWSQYIRGRIQDMLAQQSDGPRIQPVINTISISKPSINIPKVQPQVKVVQEQQQSIDNPESQPAPTLTPLQISETLESLLQSILKKFPQISLKKNLNLTLYTLIFKRISQNQPSKAWQLLENGILQNELVYGHGDKELDWRIRKIFHCFHLEIMAGIIEIAGGDAGAVYARLRGIVQAEGIR